MKSIQYLKHSRDNTPKTVEWNEKIEWNNVFPEKKKVKQFKIQQKIEDKFHRVQYNKSSAENA